MSRYRSYGKLDDPYASDGDTYFSRINARLRPSQLKPGEVQLSENGRMEVDGTWQTRKGLETLAGTITLEEKTRRLPYIIQRAKRKDNFVTLTLRTTPNTTFVEGQQLTLEGLTGFTNDPNGTFTINAVNFANKQITFAQTGVNESFTASTSSVVGAGSRIATTLSFTIEDQGATEIHGAGLFSDPNSENIDDYILTATNNYCSALRLRDKSEFRIDYPSSQTINGRCEIIQSFNKILILRGKETGMEISPSLTTKDILSASQSGTTIIVNATAHGLSENDYVTLIGLEDYTKNPNGAYTVTSASTNSFTVSASTSATETFNASGAVLEYFNKFTLVQSGPYELPAYITDSTASSSNSVVTINEPNHGLKLGQELTIIKGTGNFESRSDTKVRVSKVVSTSQFEFTLPVADTTSELLVLSHKQPIAYFIHQPPAPFGAINQRRLWLPYFYTSDAQPEQTGNTDEIIASDILDSDTFDVISNQFKITGGTSDFITAIEPFTENTLVVFGRRSVHRLNGVSGSLADVQVNVITPDIGCASRGSVAQVGSKIIFLSDLGVYSLTFIDEYNLRGLEIPLSEPITPLIERINQPYIHKAVGVYFNNRYFLAVPMDGSPENNRILVYNFINQGWESIDSVGTSAFNIRDFVIGREESQNSLYIVNKTGSIHRIDGHEGGDQVSTIIDDQEPDTLAVSSKLTTREYIASSIERKFFSRAELHLKSSKFSDSNANLSFDSTDPDNSRTGHTLNSLLGSDLSRGEDGSVRTSVRIEGQGCSATISPTLGRPFVRAVKMDSRIINRKTTSIT